MSQETFLNKYIEEDEPSILKLRPAFFPVFKFQSLQMPLIREISTRIAKQGTDTSIEENVKPIKPLPEQLTGTGEVRGFQFALVSKTDRGFCYEVRIDGTITHYEVFRRKINDMFGSESYPTAKAFGVWAWTYKSRKVALAKLNSF